MLREITGSSEAGDRGGGSIKTVYGGVLRRPAQASSLGAENIGNANNDRTGEVKRGQRY